MIGREGRKLGVDKDRIYLGPVSLPADLLGLVPLRGGLACRPAYMIARDQPLRAADGVVCTGLENPANAERMERLNEMRAEIAAGAAERIGALEEIPRIAERKARERAKRETPPLW